MPHPDIENRTPFVAEPLFLVDEEARPMLTMVVKATFDIPKSKQGTLLLSEEQAELSLGGERWLELDEAEGTGAKPAKQEDRQTRGNGEPNNFHTGAEATVENAETETPEQESSYRYEPEVAPIKLATDIVFVGYAHAPKRDTTQMNVSVQAGALGKILRVFGDRVWCRSLGTVVLSPPATFDRQPVSYEYAFGGWDRSNPDPNYHEFEARNSVGRGFLAKKTKFQDFVYAPNIEDPQQLIESRSDRPTPAGFGFISPNWQSRVQYAGTYDEAWSKDRCPLLPKDFDRKHFSAASPGLVASGFLRGDEMIRAQGLTPEGFVAFPLPGLPPPELKVSLHHESDQRPKCNLDTVIVDLDRGKLFMLWRASQLLRTGPHDLRAIETTCPAAENLPRASPVNNNEVANTQIYGVRA